jgi:PHP family Zn ribbon phosphoesterase
VGELADPEDSGHPEHRPEYIHIIPLAEIISKAVGVSTLSSKKVSGIWRKLAERFGNEISVLIDAPVEEIAEASSEEVSQAVLMFREGRVRIKPGGGGQYGKILLPGQEGYDDELSLANDSFAVREKGQKSLMDY